MSFVELEGRSFSYLLDFLLLKLSFLYESSPAESSCIFFSESILFPTIKHRKPLVRLNFYLECNNSFKVIMRDIFYRRVWMSFRLEIMMNTLAGWYRVIIPITRACLNILFHLEKKEKKSRCCKPTEKFWCSSSHGKIATPKHTSDEDQAISNDMPNQLREVRFARISQYYQQNTFNWIASEKKERLYLSQL